MSFTPLGLQESLLRAVQTEGYTQPTPIQAQAIPAILSGRDVMAAAQTGTGKTAGFTLPLLQNLGKGERARTNQVRALVLTPTRELAAQVLESVRNYGYHENLRSVVVFGGVGINPQMMAMRKGADILVATPGRLLDLYQQNAVRFDDLEVLVLDEADRMLDMGFIHDIRRILKLLPQNRQNLMFSATFSDEIRTLAKTICKNPVEIDVAPRNSTVDAITQLAYFVPKGNKIALLSTLLRSSQDQCLVFSRTKHGANKLVKCLEKDGLRAAAIHGNKSQTARTKALADFKANRVQVLVATDIAARGIDIDDLPRVINFDLPNVSEDYVHRIGRTGRAGATGLAMSLVSEDEKGLLRDIERLIKRKIEQAALPSFTRPTPVEGKLEIVSESREERQNDLDAPKKRRRRRGKKPTQAEGNNNRSRSPQGKRRDTAAANDDRQDGKPKRRRRSRSRTRSGQEGNRNATAQNAPQETSLGARIKRLFSGKKVA
jgi:ATP-dependent RNA helicase RhlE